ncbi:MAG TPA: hypothetical protein VF665_04470 [Longimicrobium sp.]|uniref:hypothetical protein n=1 Tax=Longimicrobium sp. TaxID=2029185 RepID=UPI002ED8F30D
MRRIYVDSSVIGGCLDVEFGSWSTRLFDAFRAGRFVPVLSSVVGAEIREAPYGVRAHFAELVSLGADILQVSPQVISLAETYQQRGILTPKSYDDGLHIALATVAAVDVLVSWNFKHIVHYQKVRRFNSVNRELGYEPLQIQTPREVLAHEGSED